MTVAQVTEIVMPRLSDAMEEGTIGEWLKQDGDVVRAREPIVEIETDKATIFGISRFTAVINQPPASILAVGAIEDRARPRDGKLEIARRMTVTLASDHRILYGADASRFLTDVRDRLEAPLSLVV